ncbi:unnamed protein product [Pleuronectes platessa]|uniref:Uncharacterized protein n=1 Tax=Pleuronectes platessa TaxID=8262 RepID=A0A9N7YQR7_PLEPL|nr:unnamed protein product [Pleuronectes platessa]
MATPMLGRFRLRVFTVAGFTSCVLLTFNSASPPPSSTRPSSTQPSSNQPSSTLTSGRSAPIGSGCKFFDLSSSSSGVRAGRGRARGSFDIRSEVEPRKKSSFFTRTTDGENLADLWLWTCFYYSPISQDVRSEA